MTNQQIQYIQQQRMRQQWLYRLYAAGVAAQKKNSYDKIAKVSDSYFLNYLEYSPKNIDSCKAAEYLKQYEDPSFVAGRCTGAYDEYSGKALRQLDWYFNNESEFIVKMNKDETKGIFASIGVTAASPKMTTDIAKHYITTGQYYDYFDVLPFFTVDGVNENGVFAQSNVVNKNNIEINIKKDGATNLEECCIVMVVRYILDHFTKEDLLTPQTVHDKLYDNLHIYGTSKLGGYNSHILIACHDNNKGISEQNKSYVIEFTANDIIVNEFPIITNFRTFFMSGNVPRPIETKNRYYRLQDDWNTIESNGIGLERWNTVSQFLEDYSGGASVEDFKLLREQLNYVHTYDRPFISNQTWLTDNLSGDLTIADMKDYHENPETAIKKDEIESALNGYRDQFDNRSRNTGLTWITTHSAIYDLNNLSCNIKSQLSTDEESSWNVTFDGIVNKDNN